MMMMMMMWNRQTVKAGGSAGDQGHLPRSLSTGLEASARRRRTTRPPLRRRGAGRRVRQVGEGRQGHGRHSVRSARPRAWQTLQVPRQGRQLWGREWTSRQRRRDTCQRSLQSVNISCQYTTSLCFFSIVNFYHCRLIFCRKTFVSFTTDNTTDRFISSGNSLQQTFSWSVSSLFLLMLSLLLQDFWHFGTQSG